MIHLVTFNPKIQLKPAETGYEFEYYTSDSLPDMETKEQAKDKEKHEVNAINEVIQILDVELPLALTSEELQKLQDIPTFCKHMTPMLKKRSYEMDIPISEVIMS